jgi:hypothetical protein
MLAASGRSTLAVAEVKVLLVGSELEVVEVAMLCFMPPLVVVLLRAPVSHNPVLAGTQGLMLRGESAVFCVNTSVLSIIRGQPHIGTIWFAARSSTSGAPIATLGAGFSTKMVFRVHVTAAWSLVLQAAGGDHLVAVVLDHHLTGDAIVLKVVSLAPEAPLLHLLQLRLDGTRAYAAALAL